MAKSRLQSVRDAVSDEIDSSVFKIPRDEVAKKRRSTDEAKALGFGDGVYKRKMGDIPLKNESGKTDPRVIRGRQKERQADEYMRNFGKKRR